MKLIRVIRECLPEGYRIEVRAKYGYNDWHNRYDVYVKGILFRDGVELEDCGTNVPKPSARKFIFFKNNITWKKAVETKIDTCEAYLRDWLFVKLKDDAVNEGLLDSLDKL